MLDSLPPMGQFIIYGAVIFVLSAIVLTWVDTGRERYDLRLFKTPQFGTLVFGAILLWISYLMYDKPEDIGNLYWGYAAFSVCFASALYKNIKQSNIWFGSFFTALQTFAMPVILIFGLISAMIITAGKEVLVDPMRKGE